jgi:hypothetical protein
LKYYLKFPGKDHLKGKPNTLLHCLTVSERRNQEGEQGKEEHKKRRSERRQFLEAKCHCTKHP